MVDVRLFGSRARALSTAFAMEDSFAFGEESWGFHLQQAPEKALKAWLLLLAPE
ncbi:MAG: hypothetical protein RLZZ158_473 [Cyanobacteriota bacterium]|jgi:hypothetical protein